MISPGLTKKHYAPTIPLLLILASEFKIYNKVWEEEAFQKLCSSFESIYYLAYNESKQRSTLTKQKSNREQSSQIDKKLSHFTEFIDISPQGNIKEAAHNLFISLDCFQNKNKNIHNATQISSIIITHFCSRRIFRFLLSTIDCIELLHFCVNLKQRVFLFVSKRVM